jgi:hypothetical protein
MKIYKTQNEVEKDVKNGTLAIEGDVTFVSSINLNAKIVVNAGDITARDITARDITAWDITAWDINARGINAWNITYFAFCCVYQAIKCFSIKALRTKHQKPICLDGELTIKPRK